MRWKILVSAAAVATFLLAGYTGAAGAATGTRTVTNELLRDGNPDPDRPFLWYRYDTRVGGGVGLTDDFGDPSGASNESLALTTNNLGSAKAQLYNTQVTGTDLGSITALSYSTYQSSLGATTFEGANGALQLIVDYNGGDFTDGGFTTLTYEPYLNDDATPITPDTWQPWETTEGQWFTSQNISCGEYTLPTSQGDPEKMDTLAEIAEGCPNAIVGALGVNIGSGNTNYVVAVDDIHITSAQDDLSWNFGTGAK